MGSRQRQLHLNAFLRNIGQHEAAWRLPETDLGGITGVDHYVELARIAERGKLDAVFLADRPVLNGKSEFRPFDALDPLTLVTALAAATEQIGLVATASTTYNEPYNLARRFASLDHVSGGRAAGTWSRPPYPAAAANFGHRAPGPRRRATSAPTSSSTSSWASGTAGRTTRSSATRRAASSSTGDQDPPDRPRGRVLPRRRAARASRARRRAGR